jgi:hypothetical protein
MQQLALGLFLIHLGEPHGVAHGVCDDSLSVSSTKSRSLRGCSRSTVSKAVFQVSLTKRISRCCCLAESALE